MRLAPFHHAGPAAICVNGKGLTDRRHRGRTMSTRRAVFPFEPPGPMPPPRKERRGEVERELLHRGIEFGKSRPAGLPIAPPAPRDPGQLGSRLRIGISIGPEFEGNRELAAVQGEAPSVPKIRAAISPLETARPSRSPSPGSRKTAFLPCRTHQFVWLQPERR